MHTFGKQCLLLLDFGYIQQQNNKHKTKNIKYKLFNLKNLKEHKHNL